MIDDTRDLEVLGNAGVQDLCAVLLSFPGVNPYTMLRMSIAALKERFPGVTDDLGQGNRKTFNNIAQRAVDMSGYLASRYHQYMADQSEEGIAAMTEIPKPGTISIPIPDTSSASHVTEEEVHWYSATSEWSINSWYNRSSWNDDDGWDSHSSSSREWTNWYGHCK